VRTTCPIGLLICDYRWIPGPAMAQSTDECHGQTGDPTPSILGRVVGWRQSESSDTRLGTRVACALATAAPPIAKKALFRIASGQSGMALKTSQKSAILSHSFVTRFFRLVVCSYYHPINAGFATGHDSHYDSCRFQRRELAVRALALCCE
jgi:hypothetical protein